MRSIYNNIPINIGNKIKVLFQYICSAHSFNTNSKPEILKCGFHSLGSPHPCEQGEQ